MLVPVEVLSNTRRAVRRAVSLECDLWSPPSGGHVRAVARNLSLGGIWVEGDLLLDPGAVVWLETILPGDFMPVVVPGIVRRSERRRRWTDVEPSGMGIEFTLVSENVRETLEEALVGLPPPLFPGQPYEPPWVLMWVDGSEAEALDAEPLPLRRVVGR